MKFVTREQWGATARGATPQSHPIGDVYGVTLHYEGPRMGVFGHDQCAAHVRSIQHFHKVERRWADIAYSAVVCPHGFVFEGRGPNVRTAANGTDAGNEHWYAVCGLWGDGDAFTDAAKQGYRDAITWLRNTGGAGLKVNGHRDHKATACPGDPVYRWLKSSTFPVPNPTPQPKPKPTPAKPDNQGDDMSWLDEPLNAHDPKGREETRNITVREALTAFVLSMRSGPEAAKDYLDRAAESKVD